jgi:hypothetical protein
VCRLCGNLMGQRMGKLEYGDESQECVVVCHEMVSMPWTKSPLRRAGKLARGPCDGRSGVARRGAPEVAGWAAGALRARALAGPAGSRPGSPLTPARTFLF